MHNLEILDKIKESTERAMTLKQIWNHKSTKSLLQRCHIVPESLGGKDEPSNFFLLCDRCHRMYPNTTDRDLFFIWHRVMLNDFQKYRNDVLNHFVKL